MEKNGFCDEGCGTELTFWGGVFVLFFWRDSNFSGLVFGLLTFSGESAAEYAANSGLLRKRRPSSPSVFGRGGEKPQSQNGRGGERPPPPLPFSGGEERGLLLPSRFQQGE